MNRKMRIVLKLEPYIYESDNGEKWNAHRFVEVYSSHWKVDCQNWIKRELKYHPDNIYSIYVEDN